MHVPAWPVLPDATLAPPPSTAFRVPAMAGIGALICDEYGSCYEDDTAGSASELPPVVIPVTPIQSGVSVYDPGVTLSTPPGTLINVPTSTGGTATVKNVGTAANPVYAQILGAATAGALDIAKLLAIQPGTVQQQGTTIRQTAGYPVPTPAVTGPNAPVNLQANYGFVIAAAVGVAALMFMSRR